MKISEIINRICEFHPHQDPERPTCDVIKFGDPDKECTGVVVTVWATSEVIRKAGELGANFIIVHEPLFFSHDDTTDWLEGCEVYAEKVALLEKYGIVVWRDHDHIHGQSVPSAKERFDDDYIFKGIMYQLGWEEYRLDDEMKPLLYQIPETTGRELGKYLIDTLNLNGLRVVGDPDCKVKRVYFAQHVNGQGFRGAAPRDLELIRMAESENIDAFIPLEIVDWTLTEYVRDSALLGRGKCILEMGHFNCEEIAMHYMEKWLPEVIEGACPVTYVQAGDTFSYLTK